MRAPDAMITQIHVHNYRTFVGFVWQPPPISVLVGANGSGKSALVEVLWLLQGVVVNGKPYSETGYPGTLTAWLRERRQELGVDVAINERNYSYRLKYSDEGPHRGLDETLHCDGDLLYRSEGGQAYLYGDVPSVPPTPRTAIPFETQRSFLAFLEPRQDNQRTIAFREWLRSVWALKPDPLRLGAPTAEEARHLSPSLSNFADWYRGRVQEDPDSSAALREDLRAAIPGFQGLRFEPLSPEVKELRAKFGFGSAEYEVGWGKLSDGQRLLIALYGALRFALSRGDVIALDEVENFVSPAEIQPWFRALLDVAAETGAQVIVASHHPEAIDYLAADSVWRLQRDPGTGKSVIYPLKPDIEAGETAYELVKRLQSYA